MLFRQFCLFGSAAVSLLIFPILLFAQDPTVPSVNEILDGASRERSLYLSEFKDLISKETKNLIIYDKNHEVKKRRTVISTFIVYQVGTGDQGIAEFRNVRSVNGDQVEDTEKRSQDFLNDIARSRNSGKELAKIEKESSRYDEGLTVSGMTLFKAAILADNLRPYFEFSRDGNDSINGRAVYVISYRQTKPSPFVSANSKAAANDGKTTLIFDIGVDEEANVKVDGRLWIDRNSFQIVKETRTLKAAPKRSSEYFPAAETVLDYSDSDFGILTPTRISFTQFRRSRNGRGEMKDAAVVLEYGKFERATVEVKVVEINE